MSRTRLIRLVIAGPSTPIMNRTRVHLRTSLYRNAYALILSTGLTSGLGFVYWLVAARLYPPEVVGLNSAALSALMFMAGLAQFGLTNVLIRFVPAAGRAALGLADRAFLVTIVGGLFAGLAFIIGIDRWAPSLTFLRASSLLGGGFALATATWAVFVLQEGLLTGLRQATWVPVRNAAFAVGKIGLLFVFATLQPAYGILASWIVPAGLALAPVAVLIRHRLKAAPRESEQADAPALARVQIVQYAVADYAGSLLWLAATMLVPVLVTEVAGARSNAHFYLAWTIAYTLYLVGPSMGSSLIVESAINPARLSAYSRHAFLQTARLVLPLVAIVVWAAPQILGLLGDSYAAEGTTLMRLLALSAVPNIVNGLYTSIVRAKRQVAAIVGILAAQCISVLVLSYILLLVMGITGVGLAWLVSQSAIAAVLLVTKRHELRQMRGQTEQ